MTQRAGMHGASFGHSMFLFIVLFELVQRTVSPQSLVLLTVGIATLCWIALRRARILDFIAKSQYAGKPWDCYGVFTASERMVKLTALISAHPTRCVGQAYIQKPQRTFQIQFTMVVMGETQPGFPL